IGISVQIFIGSLIQGLQISLLDATIGNASHITINADEKNAPINDYTSIRTTVTSNHSEIKNISPTLTRGAFIKVGDDVEQIVYRGFELIEADKIYKFSDALVEGTQLPEDNEILIGVDIAKDFDIRIGDTVEIITPEGDIYENKVVGTFDLKVSSINKSWVIGSLTTAQMLFDFTSDQVSAIEMQIDVPFDADVLSERMQNESGIDDILFNNWKADNEQLLSGLSGQSTSSYMIQVFVVISVVLGIASVLAITVLQKSRQIGILKAMGINDRLSSQIFLLQGLILGILGGIFGIILGLGLLWSFTKFALNPDGTPVVPIYINLSFIGLSGLIAVVASTVASIIPAIKSKKLSPIEVIKNG
ncbi:MAG: FtsX-like permease family protein, partial [Spirochaetes bacterium]|nr:FtsX-like permease family protein [Spirochaetota bacterium]